MALMVLSHLRRTTVGGNARHAYTRATSGTCPAALRAIHQCFEIVRTKTEAKSEKVAACRAAKERRVEGKVEKQAASLSLNSQVVASLTHEA